MAAVGHTRAQGCDKASSLRWVEETPLGSLVATRSCMFSLKEMGAFHKAIKNMLWPVNSASVAPSQSNGKNQNQCFDCIPVRPLSVLRQ